jgi:hypothetical protein
LAEIETIVNYFLGKEFLRAKKPPFSFNANGGLIYPRREKIGASMRAPL